MNICAIVPLAACAIALIVIPLLGWLNPPTPEEAANGVARPENRIIWPAMAAISVVLVIQNRSRLAKLIWPPHIICLFAYLAVAGASALWAFRPEVSFIRFVLEGMIIISIVPPTMLASRTPDMMRGLFLCFAFSSLLNVFFVLGGTATIVVNGGAHGNFRDYLGSPGYFSFKNYLGECAAVAFLLSIHEILHPGWRRVSGIIGVVMSIYLIVSANSKTALGLAMICPFISGLTLIARKVGRISTAIVPVSIPLLYIMVSSVSPSVNLNLLSYKMYGDSTFTGRTVIWDFVKREIDRRPLLGWGYESFWLVPGSPALFDAPGWVKMMPNGHNGYYDTMLDLGYLGFAFLLAFIIATLHCAGRVADRDPVRAWIVLTLALYVILYNLLERLWLHGFEFLWVTFVIVAAEIGRYWQPFPLSRAAAHCSTTRGLSALGPSLGTRVSQPRIGLS